MLTRARTQAPVALQAITWQRPLPLAALLAALVVTAAQHHGSPGADPLDMAEQLERAGRLEDAVLTYRAAIEGAYAAEPAAHAGLGGVLSQLGDQQGAVKAFKAALKAGGKPQYGIQFNIGLAYMQGGRLSGAVKHFKLAIKHNPAFREAHIKLASVLKDKGDLDTAIHHLQQAIDLEPANPNAYGYLGGLLNNAKRWQVCSSRLTVVFAHSTFNAYRDQFNSNHTLAGRGGRLSQRVGAGPEARRNPSCSG